MESGAKGCEVPALLTKDSLVLISVDVANVLIGVYVFSRSL